MTGDVSGLFMLGIPNITFLGLQLYLWLWVLFVIIGVCSHFGWKIGKWDPFEPLHGLYYAAKAGTDAAFVAGLLLYFNLLSEAEAKCIFDYKNWRTDLPPMYLGNYEIHFLDPIRRIFFNYASAFLNDYPWQEALTRKLAGQNDDVRIAKQYQNREWDGSPSVTVGVTPTDIILDADNWTDRKSPQHKIIEAFALKWNRENPLNQIHSYPKFNRLLAEGAFPIPPGLITEVVIPWERIDASFPLKLEDNELGGYRRQLAEEEEQAEKDQAKNYIKWMLGGTILLSLALLAARVFTLPPAP